MSHTPYIFIKLKPSPEAVAEGPLAKKHFEATKSLMTALGGLLGDKSGQTISLELTAGAGQINYIIGAPVTWEHEIVHQLYAALPACQLEVLSQWSLFNADGELAGASVQFAPPEGDLRSEEFAGADPLQPVLE